jgi:hypothetical protein
VNPGALAAIVRARLYAQRYALACACAAAFAAGFLRPHDSVAALFVCSAIGIALALLQAPGRYAHLDLCEQSAPLFGRELARGKALAACSASATAMLAYYAAPLAAGAHPSGTAFAQTTGAVAAGTLVALSATTRTGASRSFYLGLAMLTATVAYAIAIPGRSLPGELAFCAFAAALALRQYGESLARFDPV